ncbi:MAG: hypothetical protein J6Y22_05975 [Paludibacteraceae bacterium]|nr:hypothetical protein [Paludibacteraceae bacterium]
MEEDKKQNSAEKKSVIISWYQKLTKGEKNCLKGYIIWFLIHCALLSAGDNWSGFYPWNSYSKLRWEIRDYGLPEFIVYAALIPTVAYFIYSFYKKTKTK